MGHPVRGWLLGGVGAGFAGVAGVVAGFVAGLAGAGLGAGAAGAGELLETVTDDLPTITDVGAVLV